MFSHQFSRSFKKKKHKNIEQQKRNPKSHPRRTWVMLSLVTLKKKKARTLCSSLFHVLRSCLKTKDLLCKKWQRCHCDLWVRSAFWGSCSAHWIHLPLFVVTVQLRDEHGAWCDMQLGQGWDLPLWKEPEPGEPWQTSGSTDMAPRLLELGKRRVCLVVLLGMLFVTF